MICQNCGYNRPDYERVCIVCGTEGAFVPFTPAPAVDESAYCASCAKCQDRGNRLCSNCAAPMPLFARESVPETPAPAPSCKPAFCFHCHAPIPDGSDACPKCGRLVVQVVPQRGYSRGQFTALLGGIVAVIGLIALSVWLGVTHYTETHRLAAIREAQERQRRIAQELHTLQAENPVARFALYPGDGHSVRLDTPFSTCLVRSVGFTRTGDTLGVSVEMLGDHPDGQAPVVNVAVYDEQGGLISRSAIVKFTFATLGKGDIRDVDDTMEVSAASPPVFMSIDAED